MIFQKKSDLHLGKNEIERKSLISELSRSMHIQVVGATGTGKTESFLLPLAQKEMELGKCVIFIDPKGDSNTFHTFLKLTELTGRAHSLVTLNLAKSGMSQPYNPLALGTASELKDKIVGSIVWTEEFYKKIAEQVLLEIFLFFKKTNVTPTLTSIHYLLNDPGNFIIKETGDESEKVKALLKRVGDKISGLQSDIALWGKSDFSSIVSDPNGASVLDWILSKKVVYVNLNTLGFEETARRFGRLLIQDLKTAVQRIQDIDEVLRPKSSVILDEFSSIASSGFVELINKARSANVSLTLAHQSLGDLMSVSEGFRDQILDNTPNKIIFRVDSPDTADFLARLIGTRKSLKRTNQTQSLSVLGDLKTGLGSVRDVDEFIISPNDIKSLRRGEAVVITKIPYKVSKVKFIPSRNRISKHGRPFFQRGLL